MRAVGITACGDPAQSSVCSPLLSRRVGIVSIANSAFSVNGGTFMAHAGNVAVALLQIVLTRLPVVSYHFQVIWNLSEQHGRNSCGFSSAVIAMRCRYYV
jgi:hypothetical protein